MKKLILVLAIITISWSVNAQFVLTPEGFRDEKDLSKDYVVLDFENISKDKLYNKMLLFIASTYQSPKTVTSKIENEAISINAIHVDLYKFYLFHTYDLRYVISFEFKDNKVRAKVLDFSLDNNTMSASKHLDINDVFGKKGNIKNEKAKGNLEVFFNKYITNLKTELAKKSEDW